MQLKPLVEEKPIRFVLDERLDFNHRVPLRKSYIVASSYRSGSNYLCWELWRTSILGAPVEFLNPYDALPVLMNRFKAVSPADYISKLLAHRTSRNGVFGLKTHFHHFEAFLKQYPTLLDALAPVTFIHLSRRDKIAQAVSMAKALQTDFWTSRIQSERVPPQYDRELIAKCLDEIKLQDLNWPLWFEKHGITPFPVMYEDFVADPPGVVHSIQKLLGVEDDERAEVNVPPTKSQSDDTNRMWIERFRREMQVNSIHVASAAAAPEPKPAAVELPHPLDRYERFIKTLPAAPGSASGFVDAIRLRHRYGAIVARNRDLFQNARVLDIMGARGLWTLAALDAGAAHVVCMTSPESTEVARRGFARLWLRPGKASGRQFSGLAKVRSRLVRFDPLWAIFRALGPASFLCGLAPPQAEARHPGHWRGARRGADLQIRVAVAQPIDNQRPGPLLDHHRQAEPRADHVLM